MAFKIINALIILFIKVFINVIQISIFWFLIPNKLRIYAMQYDN